MAVEALYTIAAGCLLYQNLILVALFASKTEITVSNTDIVATINAQRHQYHRVYSTRNGEQNLVLVCKE
jgi:hypothetical protein